MKRLAIDLVIIVIVLVAIYGMILHVTPNLGRSLFSSLISPPRVTLRYLTRTEVKYIKDPIADEVVSPADSVATDVETGDKIAYDRWDVDYEYLKGHLDVEYRYKEETFVYKPNWDIIHKETTHYITEQITTTAPPRLFRPTIGLGYFGNSDEGIFQGTGGAFLFDRFIIEAGIQTNGFIGGKANYLF